MRLAAFVLEEFDWDDRYDRPSREAAFVGTNLCNGDVGPDLLAHMKREFFALAGTGDVTAHDLVDIGPDPIDVLQTDSLSGEQWAPSSNDVAVRNVANAQNTLALRGIHDAKVLFRAHGTLVSVDQEIWQIRTERPSLECRSKHCLITSSKHQCDQRRLHYL